MSINDTAVDYRVFYHIDKPMPIIFKVIFKFQIIMHPNYNTQTLDNDIALVKLSHPVTFNGDNKIAPICMPKSGMSFVDQPATVTGWGTTTQGKPLIFLI